MQQRDKFDALLKVYAELKHDSAQAFRLRPHEFADFDFSQDPNLITSLLGKCEDLHRPRSCHLPVLDLDFPCKLVSSKTEGHFHLLIEKDLLWQEYKLMLLCLERVGILQTGFVNGALARGASAVRLPEEDQ